MKVFVLIVQIDCGDATVEGVYSTFKKASNAKDSAFAKYLKYGYDMDEIRYDIVEKNVM